MFPPAALQLANAKDSSLRSSWHAVAPGSIPLPGDIGMPLQQATELIDRRAPQRNRSPLSPCPRTFRPRSTRRRRNLRRPARMVIIAPSSLPRAIVTCPRAPEDGASRLLPVDRATVSNRDDRAVGQSRRRSSGGSVAETFHATRHDAQVVLPHLSTQCLLVRRAVVRGLCLLDAVELDDHQRWATPSS